MESKSGFRLIHGGQRLLISPKLALAGHILGRAPPTQRSVGKSGPSHGGLLCGRYRLCRSPLSASSGGSTTVPPGLSSSEQQINIETPANTNFPRDNHTGATPPRMKKCFFRRVAQRDVAFKRSDSGSSFVACIVSSPVRTELLQHRKRASVVT